MNKNSILLVGCGRTGNVLVNEMVSKDFRYVSLMVNSSLGDMSNLRNYKLADHILFPGKDGSGKNREIAKGYVKQRDRAILSDLMKYENQKTCIMFTSSAGGTGSGTTLPIIRLIKTANPEKKIILVVAIPNLTENEISLKNTIDFWNDMITFKNKGLIDTIYLVDNSKRHTYEEINEEVVKTLDSAFSLDTFDTTGTIDQNDSEVINTAKGYSFILPLSTKYPTIKEAIDGSIKNSVFMIPQIYNCDYFGAVVQKQYFNIDDIKSDFEIYKADYRGYSNDKNPTNIIVLGGLPIPKEGIEIIQDALKDREKIIAKKYYDEDLFVKTKGENINKEIAKKEASATISNTTLSANDLDAMINSDYWDD